ELVKDAPGLSAIDALDGPGALRWRARFGSWADALGARDRCRELSGQPSNMPGAPYLFLGDAVPQYLLQAGPTSCGRPGLRRPPPLRPRHRGADAAGARVSERPAARRPDHRVRARRYHRLPPRRAWGPAGRARAARGVLPPRTRARPGRDRRTQHLPVRPG